MSRLDISDLAARLAAGASPGAVRVVGLTGSVAAGKSTLANALKAALEPGLTVEVVSTDGFLWPNAVLVERGTLMRKGYPETYDQGGLAAAVATLRTGPAVLPGYSHVIYDIDPSLSRTVAPPDILILEGLGLADKAAGLDLLVYLDAGEADLEDWFARRFVDFWRAAEHDPASFYARFRAMTEPEAEAFARSMVWGQMNLPNLREHIILARDAADIVVRKLSDHSLWLADPGG